MAGRLHGSQAVEPRSARNRAPGDLPPLDPTWERPAVRYNQPTAGHPGAPPSIPSNAQESDFEPVNPRAVRLVRMTGEKQQCDSHDDADPGADCRPGSQKSLDVEVDQQTVSGVALDDLPDWLPAWCGEHLGSEPADVLFQLNQTSMVYGLRLADGTDVVVKARAGEGRTASCVATQAWLAERGFPCARPLTAAVAVGSLAVHAEEFRTGGDVLPGDSPDVAVSYAEVFARLMDELNDLTVVPPLPNPRWVRWDHTDSGLWPTIESLEARDQNAVPAYVVDTARRVRLRLLAADLPSVLGHADFEAQNLRWHGREVWAVHDWDSLAWQPEAALVGTASGAFSSTWAPTLASIESSEAFLTRYQDTRARLFTAAEQEVAWAGSLWLAAHNARWEALHGDPPVSGNALRVQAAERLRRANA